MLTHPSTTLYILIVQPEEEMLWMDGQLEVFFGLYYVLVLLSVYRLLVFTSDPGFVHLAPAT